MRPTPRPITAGQSAAIGARLGDLSWRQAPAYADRAARDLGARSDHVELPLGGGRTGVANVRIKALPMIGRGIAFVSQGPAVSESGRFDAGAFSAAIDALAEEYVGRRKLVLRVQPPLYAGGHEDELAALFAAKRFAPIARPPYRTILIDLAPPLDDLRANLNGKWRTDLARAERQGIEVTRSEDPADIDAFRPIFDELAATKGFAPAQDLAFFRDVVEAASSSIDRVGIHLARHDGAVIAGHVGAFTGDTAVYLLGAANAKGRELRAAYLLQWAVIAHARALGQAIYDLGGIDEAANPDVYRFKKRMGGYAVETTAGYELAPGPLTRLTIRAAEAAVTRARAIARTLRR